MFFCVVDLVLVVAKYLHTITGIEKMLLRSFTVNTDSQVDILEEIAEMYKKDLSIKRLAAQLCMLHDLLQAYNKAQSVLVTSVTKIAAVCDIMSTEKSTKDVFSQVHTMLKIYLTKPMSNATTERSFDLCLASIKNISKGYHDPRAPQPFALYSCP